MHHTISMVAVNANAMGYGIRAQSEFVYRATDHYPVRVVLWDNTSRPNDGHIAYAGDGRWLSPNNKATDDMLTILLSPESIGISSNRDMTTGQPGSGQVYDRNAERLMDGDTATLVYDRNGFGNVEVTLHFPRFHNGHGHATFGREDGNRDAVPDAGS